MEGKIKYSLRRQMTAIFIGLLAFILLGVLFVNTTFLEDYYVSHKQTDLRHTYLLVNNAVVDGVISEEASESIKEQAEKMNIDVAALDENGNLILFTVNKDSALILHMLENVFNKGDKPQTILEQTDQYVITKIKEPRNGSEYLEMQGFLKDGSFFTMRSPLASIRDSAALANQFLIYIGLAGIIFGGILIWAFTRKITRPIMELAKLSQDMAALNFEARYTSGGKNEIGILGENFNRMSTQLETTISELKTAYNRLLKDMEQKEKIEDMRNEFLGNVSHELKTPIALIQGYAEGLKEGISDDPESREFYCDVIIDEAAKMNQMVKNLLTLNQLEFGTGEVEFERFDITKLVESVIASCDILIQQAEAEVSLQADGPVFVWADEFKTEQVVRNYLTNAIHHVGGERRIEARVEVFSETVRVSVFNTGSPIPEEELSKIWDKFYKVDKAHTREYGGNGIGLSIVKAIMESFRQNYGVDNKGDGVEFWFELDGGNGSEKLLLEVE